MTQMKWKYVVRGWMKILFHNLQLLDIIEHFVTRDFFKVVCFQNI